MTKRLFIACPVEGRFIDEELFSNWRTVQDLLPEHASPRREPTAYLTLRFFGDVDVGEGMEALRRLAFDLEEITRDLTGIPLVLGSLGLFEGVLWRLVGGSHEALEQVNGLQAKVGEAAKLRGCPDAAYPLPPHIVIGRLDRASPVDLEDLENHRDYPQPLDFEIDSVELLESVLPGVSAVPLFPHSTAPGRFSNFWRMDTREL